LKLEEFAQLVEIMQTRVDDNKILNKELVLVKE